MKTIYSLVFISLFVTENLVAQVYSPAEPRAAKKLNKYYIDKAMHYPQSSLENKTGGKVTVGFTVDEKGESKDFIIINGLDKALDEEAIRLSKNIRWKPALVNGRAASSRAELEIEFNPKHYLKHHGKEGCPTSHVRANADTSGLIYTFAFVDVQPKPLIDERFKNLGHYISEVLEYPEAAKAAGIQGTVRLVFVVETDGLASNIEILHSVGGGCDQEAIRILQTVCWEPGSIHELKVRTEYQLDVTFKLSDKKQQNIPNRQSGNL